MTRVAVILLGAWIVLATGCAKPDLLPPYYYVLLPQLREGQNRPSPPSNLRARYELFTENIHLEWQPGIDPDTQLPALIYRVYVFVNGPPPANIYQPRYLFDEAYGFGYNVSSDRFTGDIYFAVTAFDGLAESLPSNAARVNLLTGEVQIL